MRVTEKVGTMDRSPRRPMPSSPPCSWASTTQLQGHCGGSGTVSRCASLTFPQCVLSGPKLPFEVDPMNSRYAQIAVIHGRCGERVKSTDSVEDPLQPNA